MGLTTFSEDYLTLLDATIAKNYLTKEEYDNLGGIRKLPYVFTEQGVAMLATIIRK